MKSFKLLSSTILYLLLSTLIFSGCQKKSPLETITNPNQINNSSVNETWTNNIESNILSIYSHKTDDSKCLAEIMDMLPQINWTKYDKLSSGKAIELLNWLDSMNIKEGKYIEIIANSNDSLDGVFAEKYSTLVGNLFNSNKSLFVKSVSKINKDKIQKTCTYIKYYLDDTNKKNQIINDTEKLLNNSNNSDAEKYFLETLLDLLKA